MDPVLSLQPSGPEVTLITTNAEGIEGEKPDQEPQRRRWGGGERNADRRSHPRGNQSPPQFRDAEAAAQRFRLLGGKAAGWARGDQRSWDIVVRGLY